MARLIALSPCAGLLPLTVGGLTLTEVALGPVTLIAPFHGRRAQVSDLLQSAIGIGFPAPGTSAMAGPARILWTGPDKALLTGVPAPEGLEGLAALTDQSDAGATVGIDGPAAEAVLARLIPLDLRPAAFPQGRTARTLVNQMMASVTRTGDRAFEVMVFRSMAATLVQELTAAATGVAARP